MKKNKYFINRDGKLGKKCIHCKKIRLMKYYHIGWVKYQEGYSDICKICDGTCIDNESIKHNMRGKKWLLVYPEDNNKQFNRILEIINNKKHERDRIRCNINSRNNYSRKTDSEKHIINLKNKEWLNNNSDKRKLYEIRKDAKRRLLGHTILFNNIFSDSIPIDYHHISDGFMVAIPRDLHKLYGGLYHREKLRDIVETLYCISYIVIIHMSPNEYKVEKKAYNKKYYQEHKEKMDKRHQKYYREHKEKLDFSVSN